MNFKRTTERLGKVLALKCPRCEQGNLFINPNPYRFKNVGKMPANCAHCGQPFSLEPGFYFGAAYVSYGLTVALFVAVVVATYVLFDPVRPLVYLLAVIVAILLASPYLFLLSRSIWIAFFVKKQA